MEVCYIEVLLWQVFKYRECILSPLSFFMDFLMSFPSLSHLKLSSKIIISVPYVFLEIMRSHKK